MHNLLTYPPQISQCNVMTWRRLSIVRFDLRCRFQHLPLICVLHVGNATHFGMPLGFLVYLRRKNLPTIMSTFELWLLILFSTALLFHLMWAKFTKNSCVLFGLFYTSAKQVLWGLCESWTLDSGLDSWTGPWTDIWTDA